MLHDPDRHEPLSSTEWDEALARAAIDDIVAETEARFSPDDGWPLHPRDVDGADSAPAWPLYHGACGVIRALTYLQDIGAATLVNDYRPCLPSFRTRNAAWLHAAGDDDRGYLLGDTAWLMLEHALAPSAAVADRIAERVDANVDNPTRELMWGAPGTMLAALFMDERTGDPRWADAFRAGADVLQRHLQWSAMHDCEYWTQHMYGRHSSYLDAVHGFVATASVLIRGRELLDGDAWSRWSRTIIRTVRQSAIWQDGLVNWRAELESLRSPFLMQFCHGAPGFVVCLADLPDPALDDVLIAAGHATWRAGPLRKGSNLCHGTAGNGYALLKLHARFGHPQWLDGARRFAMHAIAQMRADRHAVGHLRYSLWTGDLGLAIYLHDCLQATPSFPTLDVFFGVRRDRPDATG